MPYIQNEKDRFLIDCEVGNVAHEIINSNGNEPVIRIFDKFYQSMRDTCMIIDACQKCFGVTVPSAAKQLGRTIFNISEQYNYLGAWLGILNYATTRLIQVLPKLLVEEGLMKVEFRYWYYAEIVGYLGALVKYFQDIDNINWIDQGFAGVLEDVKDEYKRRVNIAYEAQQIIDNGDCYDTPYYTKLVEVYDQQNQPCGYAEIMVKRSDSTLGKRVIGKMQIILGG
jgi:hypothetical protein